MPDYEHLRIEREPLENNRRTRRVVLPSANRGDIAGHAGSLERSLAQAMTNARRQVTSRPGFILKLKYTGHLDVSHLERHGVEFISHEEKEICIVFTTEEGLAVFENQIKRLGLEDEELTYKQILEAIDGIENWTEEDRKSWIINKRGLPEEEEYQLDIELWPIAVAHHPDRLALCQSFENWLDNNEIERIDKINLDSLLMYRVKANAQISKLLLNHSDIRLVDLTPSTGIEYKQLDCDINDLPAQIQSPPEGAAKVCILDSGINTNHPLLAPAIAESAGFLGGDDDVFDLDGHGTAVAGVALYGDVEACNELNLWQPEIYLLNGKILNDDCEYDEGTIEKTLVEAVTFFVEEHQCRIFNLSIGNANAPYDQKHIRGVAYILDKLARDLNVLFIISAGNFNGAENPAVPANCWRDEYPGYLGDPASVIIDPATSMNSITVGSLAKHNATFDHQRYPQISQLSPATENQPSPFTRHGPSVKGAIKPELISIGGNLASPTGNTSNITTRGLGVLTCNANFVGHTVLREISGTSFSAPYVSHLAGRLLNSYPRASANLLRAMLINHAHMPTEVETTFSDEYKAAYKEQNKTDIVRDVAGYGRVEESELFRSTEHAVVLMAEDGIENDMHHFYELPFPKEFLRSNRAAREVRVTLAYTPAVRTTRLDYLATKIHYRLVKGASLEEVQRHFNQQTQRETETRNDDATSNRDISAELRSKGTVQSSVWRKRQFSPNEKWFVVVTRQDKEWGSNFSSELEEYALVVTVTDRENEEAELYTKISQHIEQQAILRAQTQARV